MLLRSERFQPRCEGDGGKSKQDAANAEYIRNGCPVSDNVCQSAHRPLLREKVSNGLHQLRLNFYRPIHSAHHTRRNNEQVAESKLLLWCSDIGSNHQPDAHDCKQKKGY